ncbi:MAG: hypothetical protein EZS28_008916 [Streblomastix strix]|uniref:Uncharacterized protein n=1 Tax=Streblomastix strix TaxID=222440 RepID=A0A5J4WKH8_9EUKA|nr:MAG: hypothetical protein EZS28_008916 [Streblomastix strix]
MIFLSKVEKGCIEDDKEEEQGGIDEECGIQGQIEEDYEQGQIEEDYEQGQIEEDYVQGKIEEDYEQGKIEEDYEQGQICNLDGVGGVDDGFCQCTTYYYYGDGFNNKLYQCNNDDYQGKEGIGDEKEDWYGVNEYYYFVYQID